MTETTSQINPEKSAPGSPVMRNRTIRMYRRCGLSNLLKMGHCAPSVMQTLQDLGNTKEEWMVKMTAGLPTVIYAGHDYLHRFQKCNNSLLCKEILGDRRVPLPCIKFARHAPEL